LHEERELRVDGNALSPTRHAFLLAEVSQMSGRLDKENTYDPAKRAANARETRMGRITVIALSSEV